MKVYMLNDGSYQITKDGKSTSFRDHTEAALYMYDQGVSFDEVELGFNEMVKQGHNVSHYGIGFRNDGPKFIFTERLAS